MSSFIEYLGEHSFWYRLPLIFSSFILFYTALLMYEDQEGNLQNRLEQLWCKLDDAANKALNTHLHVVQWVASKAVDGTEGTLGKELISNQSIGVCICWGIISAKLTVVILGFSTSNPPTQIIVGQLFLCLIFYFVSMWPQFLHPSRHGWWLSFVIFCWIVMTVSAFYGGTQGERLNPLPPVPEGSNIRVVRMGLAVIPLYIFGVLFSIPISIVLFAILRRSLRLISNSRSNRSVIAATALQGVFLLSLISLHMLTFTTLVSKSDLRQYMFQTITPVMGPAYLLTIFLILMLAHMFFWGTMQRPIYALARLGIERRKRLFAGIGVLLLGLAFPNIIESARRVGLDLIKSILG
jgi:hypothetical protein